MTSSLRVESSIASRADLYPLRVGAPACFAANLILRDGRQCVCLQLIGVEDAIARPALAAKRLNEGSLPFGLDSSSFHHVTLHRFLLGQFPEQQPRSQHFEAITPARAVDDLGDAVQGFRVAVRNPVVKVGEHLLTPVPGGREQRGEALLPLLHVGRHGLAPVIQTFLCIRPGRCIVDVVERFLELVGRLHMRLVVQPHLEVESPLLVQVLVAHPEQRLASHPVTTHGLLLVLGEGYADVVHSAVCHSHQVELVDNDRQARQDRLGCILVWPPHVDGQALDAAAVLELMQPCGDERLVTVGQHVNGNPVHHVGDDASEFAVNLRLVDAQPLWQPWFVFRVQAVDVAASQGADGFVITTDVLSDAREGIAQALFLDVLRTPGRHSHSRMYSSKGLDERAAAIPALEALGVGLDTHRTATDGAVSKANRLGAVLVEMTNYAAFLARIGQNCVVGRDDVLVVFRACRSRNPAWKVKNVCHGLNEAVSGGAIVPKKDAVLLIKVRLPQWHAIMMQEGVRVSDLHLPFEPNSGLPVRRLVVADVAPFLGGMVGTHVTGAAWRLWPVHPLYERHTVPSVHGPLNQRIARSPLLASALLNPIHLVHADAEPGINGIDALTVSPTLYDFPLPVGGTPVGKLPDVAALRGKGHLVIQKSAEPYGGCTPEPQKIPSFHIVNINRLISAEECWSDVR